RQDVGAIERPAGNREPPLILFEYLETRLRSDGDREHIAVVLIQQRCIGLRTHRNREPAGLERREQESEAEDDVAILAQEEGADDMTFARHPDVSAAADVAQVERVVAERK